MLSIRLLGSPQLTLNDHPLSLPRRKSRAIVYYLAAHPRPVTRDHLLAFFWPDLDRRAAQQTLRTTLHGLRKALGPALLVDDESLALGPDVEVDIRLFETNLQPSTSNLQSLTSTLALYRGEFLDGFSLPDSPAFDDWAAVERERYRRLAVRGLTALSQQHETNRDFGAALDALDRALASDPLQEDLQRAAMRLHYLAGDRAGAVRRYDALRQLLDDEMGVPPMTETRALYDAIINDRLQIPTPDDQPSLAHLPSPPLLHSPAPLPFTGRAAELNILRALTASGKLVLLEGEPGLGKTRLAEEFLHEAKAITLVGTARELEHALPYQPVIEALRSLLTRADWPALRATLQASLSAIWLAETARLLPELSPDHLQSPMAGSQSDADESRLWEGVHQWMLVLARQHPLILFLDDLHWADAATLALLGYLTRRGRSETGERASVLFLGATRSVAPRSSLAALVQTLTREGRLVRLPLARLAREDIAVLVQHLCPTPVEPLADWLARFSEGNPYIVVELVRYAREKSILRDDGTFDSEALTRSPVVPQSVYTLVQSRLARLSDAARRMLDAAVAVGRDFEFEIAARAAALSENAALDALDELRAAGLVYPHHDDATGRLYTFDHTLTMEVAYREVEEPRHRLMHRRVAEALESMYRNRLDLVAGLLASHFAEGNAPERAAPHAFRAGQLASRVAAWKEAIAFCEQALLGEAGESRRAEIFLTLGQARMQAGEPARASEDFRAALAHPEPSRVAEAQAALAQSLLTQARYAEVVELVQQMLETPASPSRARAEALWGTALSLEGTDLAGAAEHLQNAAAFLRDESGPVDRPQLAQITFELGSVAAQQGDLPRAVMLYREALATAQAAESDFAIPIYILAHNNLAYHLHLLGDLTAVEYARVGVALAHEKGRLTLLTYLYSTSGEIALAAHDLDRAEGYFAEGLALAERYSMPERIAGLTANLGLVARARGDTTLAVHRLSNALARADTLGTRHLAAQIRIWLVPLLPPAEARAHLTEARAIAESGGRHRLLDEIARLESES